LASKERNKQKQATGKSITNNISLSRRESGVAS